MCSVAWHKESNTSKPSWTPGSAVRGTQISFGCLKKSIQWARYRLQQGSENAVFPSLVLIKLRPVLFNAPDLWSWQSPFVSGTRKHCLQHRIWGVTLEKQSVSVMGESSLLCLSSVSCSSYQGQFESDPHYTWAVKLMCALCWDVSARSTIVAKVPGIICCQCSSFFFGVRRSFGVKQARHGHSFFIRAWRERRPKEAGLGYQWRNVTAAVVAAMEWVNLHEGNISSLARKEGR